MIKAIDISFSYTDTYLFMKGNFSVGKGMKVGVAGPNGAGKSTLFKLITGEEVPDTGTIAVEGTVASVPQEVKYDPALDASSTIKMYLDPLRKKGQHELEKMMAGIGLTLDLKSAPQSLSGGQKTRLAILRALIAEPDILLLDEPTNFLDIEGKKWVMDFLSRYPHTLILISHDMQLIDRYINKIIAINPLTSTLEEQNGTYARYLDTQKEKEAMLKRHIIKEQKHIKHMKHGLEKMARYTSKKGERQRAQLKKRVQRLEDKLPDAPKELKAIRFNFPDPARIGELPIVVKHVGKSFGDEDVLRDVSFVCYRNERVALIGPNGAGKSTFIKIIMGLLPPDSGEVIRDAQLDIGYYSQEKESFNEEQTILEMMRAHTESDDNQIRPLLAGFLFSGNKVHQEIKKLSGGEKTRLSIARLLSKNHNMLILDEPTTYLDVMSQRIILEALKKYKGTLLIVTHTEGFMRELKPDRALLLPENRVVTWGEELFFEVTRI